MLRRDVPHAGRNSRGTGSSHQPVGGVAVATPPPDPKRTDREALARRRAAQLQAALAQARVFLGQGELAQALDACEQALTLEETHAEALELEEEIRAAFAAAGAAAVADEARNASFSVPDYAPTVLAPPRRTPAAVAEVPLPQIAMMAAVPEAAPLVQPRTVAPRRAGPSVFARARVAVRAFVVRTGAATSAATLRMATLTRGAAAHARLAVVRVGASAAAIPLTIPAIAPRVRQNVAWGGAVLVLVGTAAVAGSMLWPAAVPARGVLVIDAVPWGTITRVAAENGERQPLPSPASTPLAMSLLPGTYQVHITGPNAEGPPQQITVRVESGGATVMKPVQFGSVTPEEYFEPYLTAAAPTPVDAAPVEGGTAPDSGSAAVPPVAGVVR
jgi:hypothetical protein